MLSQFHALFSQHAIFQHDFGVAFLNDREIFIFHVHPMSHVGISGRHRQSVEDAGHISIVIVCRLIKSEHVAVVLIHPRLVEDAQHSVKSVVDLAVKAGYLNDDALMREALYKGIGQPLCHHVAVVTANLLVHINDRLLDVAHLMPEKIDSDHRQSVAVFLDVFRVGVVHSEVLSEA